MIDDHDMSSLDRVFIGMLVGLSLLVITVTAIALSYYFAS